MKAAFKIIWLLCTLLVLFTQCEEEPEPEPPVEIQDANFLNALIESGIDRDGDGIISSAEAAGVNSLDISYREISDLHGIEAFINLDTLSCSGNLLSTLDVSNNTSLKYLNCGGNLLSSLDVSTCTALYYFVCHRNQLTALDVSDVSVINLLCGNNPLSSLDVSQNTNLMTLSCGQTLLNSLDVFNNIYLMSLECTNLQLTSLDISNNISLGTNEIWESIPDIVLDSMPIASPNAYFTTACNN